MYVRLKKHVWNTSETRAVSESETLSSLSRCFKYWWQMLFLRNYLFQSTQHYYLCLFINTSYLEFWKRLFYTCPLSKIVQPPQTRLTPLTVYNKFYLFILKIIPVLGHFRHCVCHLFICVPVWTLLYLVCWQGAWWRRRWRLARLSEGTGTSFCGLRSQRRSRTTLPSSAAPWVTRKFIHHLGSSTSNVLTQAYSDSTWFFYHTHRDYEALSKKTTFPSWSFFFPPLMWRQK